MNHTTSSARTPFLRSGITALRGVFGGGGGSGAPSLGVGGGRTSSLRLLGLPATLLAALAVAALLALTAASASAAPPAEFGTEGSGAGQINEPRGVAVDQETHDVYLADNEVLFSGAAA